MGRTLKRVPLDFEWPLGKVWGGYLNPFVGQCTQCPACGGGGRTPEQQRIYDQWYGNAPFDPVEYGAKPLTIDHPALLAVAERQCERTPDYYGTGPHAVLREARRLLGLWKNQWCHHLIQADVDALIAGDRLWDFTRVPRTEEQAEVVRQKIANGGNSWLPESNGYTPTADEVNAWSLGGMAHDGINSWICVQARCKREGVETTCKRCGGDGTMWPSKEIEDASESWKETEPPTGAGFQLWTTTNEGAPIGPVFSTIEELCAWAADNATTFASYKASAEEWRRMLDADFVVHQQGNAIFM